VFRSWCALRLMTSVAVVTLCAAVAFCQTPTDRHMNDRSNGLYVKSAYAHGYMHGYEEGFHNGDLDVHMGRGERPLAQVKGSRECAGYRTQFGDKRYFHSGYQQGFREGYADAANGRSFRAVAETRRIAEGMTGDASLSASEFDAAFSRGYDTGRDVGSKATTDQVDESYTTGLCASRLPQSRATNQTVCDAFSRGFQLGFADGHVNRGPARTETARNAGTGRK
jgi:hypothetical protein